MAELNLTDEQKKAIETDGSLIVSAAAGSGKTFVLVRRIINKILRRENPISVDRLLIVTFTRAAANEMRQRLSVALEKEIEKEPGNKFLLRQQAMLPLADICTMDQFFNSLVKDNFHRLKITPDFRIIDSSEADVLSKEALDEVLDEAYNGERESFERLLNVLGCDRNDKTLADDIEKLNRYANSYPYPEKWLSEISDSYTDGKKPQETVYGEILLKMASEYADYAIKQLEYAADLIKDISALKKASEVISSDIAQAVSIKNAAESGKWNDLYNLVNSLTFPSFPRASKETNGLFERDYAKLLRDAAKETLKSIAPCICADEDDFAEDSAILSSVVPELIKIVVDYRKRYALKKAEENALEFDDITHLALNLLVEDGEYTDIAGELREKYDEILIDEYQDTNSTQDAIFSALSKDENNLFIVGDVKQSIYGFRLAMPEIFLKRIESQRLSTDPSRTFVNLDRNFRSRKEVLDGANYVFGKIMNSRTGNVVYDKKESLKAGADYPETAEPKMEMYVLDRKGKEAESLSEISFVADKIQELLESGEVYDDKAKKMRRAEEKDICVLLRRNKLGPSIVTELKKRGISSYFDSNEGFFKNTEVMIMLSLLSVIDNPLQDVPLLSVLMSPVFGFTADDISRLRIAERKESLYHAVRAFDSEKCRNFVKEYDGYKKLSTVVGVSELLRTVYDRTGYLSVVSAMSNGETRKLNLMLLTEYAQSYEEYGANGLPGFMRYIELMKKNDSDFKPAVSVSENASVVRIMSVHKSKGLEFPIVILADTASGRGSSGNGTLALNQKTGLGLKICDKATYRKYSTVQYEATKYIQSLDECSEALRALYVAMTRAKEKLIITGSVGNLEETARGLSAYCFENKIDSVATQTKSGFLKYLLMCFFRHTGAGKLRYYADYKGGFDADSGFSLKFDIVTELPEASEKKAESIAVRNARANPETVAEIKKRAQYEYEFMPLVGFSTKMSASELNRAQNQTEFYITEKPTFAKKGGLTAAERGTAMHRFMEVCDFKAAKENAVAERERLVSERLLTPEQGQSLDMKLINGFFESELYRRIEKSDRVLREQKFTVFLPLEFAADGENSVYNGERVLVQGVIDCAFFEDGKLVVLDYKTDRVQNTDELAERYKKQLEVYKIAAEQTFSVEVRELAVYSFYLGEEKII